MELDLIDVPSRAKDRQIILIAQRTKSLADRHRNQTTDRTGQLQLSLRILLRSVYVHVVQARYLQLPIDTGYATHVEVKVAPRNDPSRLITHCFQTKSVSDSSSPQFDETFCFDVSPIKRHSRIFIELYLTQNSPDSGNKTFLGGMSFDLQHLQDRMLAGTVPASFGILPNRPRSVTLQNDCSHPLSTLSDGNSIKSISSLSISQERTLSAPSWYYLFSKPNSYRRHMMVPSGLKPLRPLNDPRKLEHQKDNKSENSASDQLLSNHSYQSVNTAASVRTELNGITRSSSNQQILIITIPPSDSGYGFTLRSSTDWSTSPINRCQSSTPRTSATTMNGSDTEKPVNAHSKICICHVQDGSPADQAGLPVGAYLVEIDGETLEQPTTLKQAVCRLRRSASKHPQGAVTIGVELPQQPHSQTGNLTANNCVQVACGSTLICEERCIDPVDPMESNSSGRRKRFFKLAHPILQLKWSDVTAEEALRQWAIADLLSNGSRLVNELLAGVRVYLVKLREAGYLDRKELNLIFRNMTEITSMASKLFRSLNDSCLPYTRTDDPPTIPCGKLSLSNDGSTPSERIANKAVRILKRIRRSLVGSRSNNEIGAKNDSGKPLNGVDPSVSSSRTFLPRSASENALNRINVVLSGKENEGANTADYPMRILTPPPHGHLDKPGCLTRPFLKSLLDECVMYSVDYLDRLRYLQELRRGSTQLREFLRKQSMVPGVPTLSNFLMLPHELTRRLMVDLEKVKRHTGPHHIDQQALDECVSLLRDVVLSPNVEKSLLSTSGSSRSAYLSRRNSVPVDSNFPMDSMEQTAAPQLTISKTAEPPSGSDHTPQTDTELGRLALLVQEPLFPSSQQAGVASVHMELLRSSCLIIYRGLLECIIDRYAMTDTEFEGKALYTGKAFTYLLPQHLLLVGSDTDILVENEPAALLCYPVPLKSICLQQCGTDMRIAVGVVQGIRIQLSCTNNEEKVVWKTLLQHRISLA
ncbi:hypothetical protein CRM22_001304 [Opisthorchis felineus]|uniref:DH domain-containing protein n=1 Tax=Opisthorchis felineus TaxID=147828 RepID=A0A4S2MB44_OPIFE|nr:hypothetical protein CRM22_001304 [Opisthorchis felineus]